MEKIKELIQTLNEKEIEEVIELCKQRLDELKKSKGLVKCVFETEDWFDARKHGNAYVAVIVEKNGKIEREFLYMTQKVWDTKKKYYKARWEVELPVGTKIEARLTDGSWKNDYKRYFIVKEDGLESATREEVLGL